MKRLTFILGTRPEAIKLMPVILEARQLRVRSDAVDITELAIARVNEAMESQGVDDGQAQELPEAGGEDTQDTGQQPAE